MPAPTRRGQPGRGVRLSAPVQAPSTGTPTDHHTSAAPAELDDPTPKDRTLAVFITCTAVAIIWVLIVLIMKLPGIALAPLLVVVVIAVVGISWTRRAASRPTKRPNTKEPKVAATNPLPVPATPVQEPSTAPAVETTPKRERLAWVRKIPTGIRRSVDYVPFLGKRKQRRLAEQAKIDTRDARIATLEGEIITLGRPRRMYVDGAEQRWTTLHGKFSFNSVKSSGKTTTAENCASHDARLTKGNVLLLPMTTVPGDGAMRSGVFDKNTLTVSEVFALLPDLKSGKLSGADFLALIDQNEYGVYVIAPDFEDDVEMSMTDFQDLLNVLDNYFHRIYMDGGNNLRGAEEAAVRNADQVVFTMFTGITSTKYMLGKTMDKYASNPYLRSKGVAENSIVLVNGLRGNERPEDYKDYAVYTYAYSGEETDQRISQRRFKGRVMGVRWDDNIYNRMFCRLESQSADTTLDYLELLFQLFQDAITSQKSDTDTLGSIIEAEHAQISGVPYVEELYDARHPSTDPDDDSSSEEPSRSDNLHHIHSGDQPTTQGSLALQEGK